MTWAHKDGCLSPIADYPLIDTYTGMQERLKTSYLEMAYQNNAWCAPVGMVWQQVRRERPDYKHVPNYLMRAHRDMFLVQQLLLV